jgi:hypothetical protein
VSHAQPSALLRARLAQEVGQAIARTAEQISQGPVSSARVRLLIDDLYGTAEQPRAAARFHALAGPLLPLALPWLAAVAHALAEIDALESAVRGADLVAVRRAATLAREIRAALTEQDR